MVLENLLEKEARTEPFLRNVVEMARAIINPAYAQVDLVRMSEMADPEASHLFVVVHTGPYAYRFAVPPDERMWVAEYRNDVVDPPLYWDEYGDGPLVDADQQIVANWLADIAAPGDRED